MNNEQLKKGYKRTDVGIVPEDWDVKALDDLVSFNNGKAHESEIKDFGQFVVVNSKFISSEGEVKKYSNQCFCPTTKENILMVMSDVPYGKAIAKCYFVEEDGKYTVNQRICSLKAFGANPKYLFYQLNRNPYFLRFDDGVKQTNLRKREVLSCPLPIPKMEKEQRAISTALSDVDALIAALDKLIAKKRAIKTATMQQLLTGKKRLPAFKNKDGFKQSEIGMIPNDWNVEPLPNVAWFQEEPGLRNWQFKKNGMKVINVTNLEDGRINLNRTDRHISLDEFKKTYSHFEIQACDIVMASSGNSYCKTSVVSESDLPLMMNTSVIRFKPINNYEYDFLLAYLFSTFFKEQIDLLITGGAQPNFGPYHLRKVFLPVPKPEEQRAIAIILSKMDAEITALESRRNKTQAIKQGMMQELLTGRTRLI